MKIEKVIASVFAEIERAETLHPAWPRDPVKACSLLAAEAGEAIRAANTFDETRTGKKMIIEATHTAAMAIHFLKNIEETGDHE